MVWEQDGFSFDKCHTYHFETTIHGHRTHLFMYWRCAILPLAGLWGGNIMILRTFSVPILLLLYWTVSSDYVVWCTYFMYLVHTRNLDAVYFLVKQMDWIDSLYRTIHDWSSPFLVWYCIYEGHSSLVTFALYSVLCYPHEYCPSCQFPSLLKAILPTWMAP